VTIDVSAGRSFADVELEHFELAVETDDRVEDDVEDRRVDEMTFGFEDFADGSHELRCAGDGGS
jgi:hypothetical protein